NQPFSQWNTIFSDDMMTVAAVDRLVHHALIVEIQAQSYRKHSATAHQQDLSQPQPQAIDAASSPSAEAAVPLPTDS
ncbi:MAG: ATP-binding protein, partial [Microcoleaceae cyanobacterium]